MANPYFQVSRDAARALSEFSDEMRGALALGDFETWAGSLGHVRQTNALKTTFPIPVSAAGYHEFKGDMKYRSLYARSLSMTTKNWQDGVAELAAVVEAPDFIDWSGEPSRMATEWSRLPNQLVADMLAESAGDGPLLDFYRDPDTNTASTRRLFASNHPFNVFKTGLGTFDNTATTTVAAIESGDFFSDTEDYFASINGPNGKPLGLSILGGGNILVPAARYELFRRVLTFDTLTQVIQESGANVAAVTRNNIYKGTVSVTRAFELADQDVFYVLAAGKPGLFPWVVQQEGAPEEFLHDKTSEMYKRELKIGVAYVGRANVAACLPHGILRVTITG